MAKSALVNRNIISEWRTFIQGATSERDGFFGFVTHNLKDAALPTITWEIQDVGEKEGFLGFGVRGELRKFVKVTDRNFYLLEAYLGSQVYGNYLCISRFLTHRNPNFTTQVMPTMPVFQYESLTAFNNIVHQAVLDAVESIMERAGQDFSKIDTKSKGFLNVW